jgi:hypothetical protein
VDYVLLNRIVVEEMAIRSDLLEHVAHRIITRIFEEIPEVSELLWRFLNSILLLAVTLNSYYRNGRI